MSRFAVFEFWDILDDDDVVLLSMSKQFLANINDKGKCDNITIFA